MATILNFRPAVPECAADAHVSHDKKSAEVIAFPGVRYEHWHEARRARDEAGTRPQQSSQSKAQSKVKGGATHRDVLELAD
jgi:hypothetical protein